MNGPWIGIEDFRRLSLKVGTLRAIEPLIDDLAAVVVDLEVPLDAVAPWASLAPESAGQRVVVATGLHPFTVAGRCFTAMLVTVNRVIAVVSSEIPDGSPLS